MTTPRIASLTGKHQACISVPRPSSSYRHSIGIPRQLANIYCVPVDALWSGNGEARTYPSLCDQHDEFFHSGTRSLMRPSGDDMPKTVRLSPLNTSNVARRRWCLLSHGATTQVRNYATRSDISGSRVRQTLAREAQALEQRKHVDSLASQKRKTTGPQKAKFALEEQRLVKLENDRLAKIAEQQRKSKLRVQSLNSLATTIENAIQESQANVEKIRCAIQTRVDRREDAKQRVTALLGMGVELMASTRRLVASTQDLFRMLDTLIQTRKAEFRDKQDRHEAWMKEYMKISHTVSKYINDRKREFARLQPILDGLRRYLGVKQSADQVTKSICFLEILIRNRGLVVIPIVTTFVNNIARSFEALMTESAILASAMLSESEHHLENLMSQLTDSKSLLGAVEQTRSEEYPHLIRACELAITNSIEAYDKDNEFDASFLQGGVESFDEIMKKLSVGKSRQKRAALRLTAGIRDLATKLRELTADPSTASFTIRCQPVKLRLFERHYDFWLAQSGETITLELDLHEFRSACFLGVQYSRGDVSYRDLRVRNMHGKIAYIEDCIKEMRRMTSTKLSSRRGKKFDRHIHALIADLGRIGRDLSAQIPLTHRKHCLQASRIFVASSDSGMLAVELSTRLSTIPSTVCQAFAKRLQAWKDDCYQTVGRIGALYREVNQSYNAFCEVYEDASMDIEKAKRKMLERRTSVIFDMILSLRHGLGQLDPWIYGHNPDWCQSAQMEKLIELHARLLEVQVESELSETHLLWLKEIFDDQDRRMAQQESQLVPDIPQSKSEQHRDSLQVHRGSENKPRVTIRTVKKSSLADGQRRPFHTCHVARSLISNSLNIDDDDASPCQSLAQQTSQQKSLARVRSSLDQFHDGCMSPYQKQVTKLALTKSKQRAGPASEQLPEADVDCITHTLSNSESDVVHLDISREECAESPLSRLKNLNIPNLNEEARTSIIENATTYLKFAYRRIAWLSEVINIHMIRLFARLIECTSPKTFVEQQFQNYLIEKRKTWTELYEQQHQTSEQELALCFHEVRLCLRTLLESRQAMQSSRLRAICAHLKDSFAIRSDVDDLSTLQLRHIAGKLLMIHEHNVHIVNEVKKINIQGDDEWCFMSSVAFGSSNASLEAFFRQGLKCVPAAPRFQGHVNLVQSSMRATKAVLGETHRLFAQSNSLLITKTNRVATTAILQQMTSHLQDVYNLCRSLRRIYRFGGLKIDLAIIPFNTSWMAKQSDFLGRLNLTEDYAFALYSILQGAAAKQQIPKSFKMVFYDELLSDKDRNLLERTMKDLMQLPGDRSDLLRRKDRMRLAVLCDKRKRFILRQNRIHSAAGHLGQPLYYPMGRMFVAEEASPRYIEKPLQSLPEPTQRRKLVGETANNLKATIQYENDSKSIDFNRKGVQGIRNRKRVRRRKSGRIPWSAPFASSLTHESEAATREGFEESKYSNGLNTFSLSSDDGWQELPMQFSLSEDDTWQESVQIIADAVAVKPDLELLAIASSRNINLERNKETQQTNVAKPENQTSMKIRRWVGRGPPSEIAYHMPEAASPFEGITTQETVKEAKQQLKIRQREKAATSYSDFMKLSRPPEEAPTNEKITAFVASLAAKARKSKISSRRVSIGNALRATEPRFSPLNMNLDSQMAQISSIQTDDVDQKLAKQDSGSQAANDANEKTMSSILQTAMSGLEYNIRSDLLREAFEKTGQENATNFSYEWFRNAHGQKLPLHYCKSFQASEKVAAMFLEETVIGFDLEWNSKVRASTTNVKEHVSVVQLASPTRIAIFQLALHKGTTPDTILPPSLRHIMESEEIIKLGVGIMGDFTRLRTHFAVDGKGIFELSHLHNLVTDQFKNSAQADNLEIARKLVALSKQVLTHLYLTLGKGAVRTSRWHQELKADQCFYAANDAWVAVCLFYELERKRLEMDPIPQRPPFAETGLPIIGARKTESELVKDLEESDTSDEDYVSFSDESEDDDGAELSSEHSEESENFVNDELSSQVDSLTLDYTSCSIPTPAQPSTADQPHPTNTTSQEVIDTSIPLPSSLSNLSAATLWITNYTATITPKRALRVGNHKLHAYTYWHHQNADLLAVAASLGRKNTPALVATYILDSIELERLPYDADRAQELLDYVTPYKRRKYEDALRAMGSSSKRVKVA